MTSTSRSMRPITGRAQSEGASYHGQIIGNVMYGNGNSGYEPIHINAYMDYAVVEGNIVSYSGGTGMALQTGVYHAWIADNIFFDDGRDCITLYLYDPRAVRVSPQRFAGTRSRTTPATWGRPPMSSGNESGRRHRTRRWHHRIRSLHQGYDGPEQCDRDLRQWGNDGSVAV